MEPQFMSKNRPGRLNLMALWVLLATLWGTVGAAANDRTVITVTVRAQSSVDQDTILLGDIAQIGGAESELSGRLKAIAIGKAPLPGRSRILSTADVSVRLRQAGVDYLNTDDLPGLSAFLRRPAN